MKNPSEIFFAHLANTRQWVDERLTRQLERLEWHPEMKSSAHYVVSGGGKAVRPALVFWAYQQFSGNPGRPPESVLDLALALEFVHSYSLVHDDLPCMDNDDFRRGRPTLHRIQSEALAVLAGDALLTGAFEILAMSSLTESQISRAVLEIGRAAGGAGMVAGQVMDLDLKAAMKAKKLTKELLVKNHNLKTGALFGVALAFASIGAGDSVARQRSARAWGVKLGLLFQVVDDILDAGPVADAKGDEGPNFVNLLGLDQTREFARTIESELTAESRALGTDAATTGAVLDFFVQRTV